MVCVLRKSLSLAFVTLAFASAQTGVGVAQVTLASAADIPLAADGEVEAYYESATGDVYVSIGAGISLYSLDGADFLFENVDAESPLISNPFSLPPICLIGSCTLIPTLLEVRNGIFNIGDVLPADSGITDVGAFQASPFGAAEIFFSRRVEIPFDISTPSEEVTRSFNVISAVPEPGSLSLLVVAALGLATRRRW